MAGIVADVKDDEEFMIDYTREILMPLLAEHYPITNLEKVNDRWIRSFENYRMDLYETVVPVEPVDWSRFI